MPLPAAVTGLAVLALIGYLLTCWFSPFGRCLRCDGTGLRPALITRRLKPCRTCRGAGIRLRLGRQLQNWTRRTLTDATDRDPRPAHIPDWDTWARHTHNDPDHTPDPETCKETPEHDR